MTAAAGGHWETHFAASPALLRAPPGERRRPWLARPPLAGAGGTRFIGVYLARMLVEAGHEVTLLTRGKKAVTYQVGPGGTEGPLLWFLFVAVVDSSTESLC